MAKIESLSELDDYKKQKEWERKTRKPIFRIIIIVGIILFSLLLGVIVYFAVNGLIGKKEPPVNQEFIGEQIALDDENVQILYEYVTVTAEGRRNTKFAENKEVALTNFTEKEKLYYSLQFVRSEDIEFTGEYDHNKRKIYTLPVKKVNEYVKVFFGPNAIYSPESAMTYPFNFSVNKMNVGQMKYNSDRDGYDIVFDSRLIAEEQPKAIESVYGKLISALRQPDGSVVLQERVVYTVLRTENGTYSIDIYKDPEKTIKLDTKTNITDADIPQLNIDPSIYQSTAIVEYTFGLNGSTCYFNSSRIIM